MPDQRGGHKMIIWRSFIKTRNLLSCPFFYAHHTNKPTSRLCAVRSEAWQSENSQKQFSFMNFPLHKWAPETLCEEGGNLASECV